MTAEIGTSPLLAPQLRAGSQHVAGLDHPLLPASLVGLEDERLASPMLHDPEFRAEVDRWIGRWATSFSDWMPAYLERMTGLEAMVDSTLAAGALPWSLRYLPVIESGNSPTQRPAKRGGGLRAEPDRGHHRRL